MPKHPAEQPVVRVDAEATTGQDRPRLLGHGQDAEGGRVGEAVADREDLERPAEVQHFHVVKEQDGESSCPVHDDTTASASISTRISGAISRLTSTMLVAGRMSLKNSPCALPTCSHWSMFTTYIRVRTTSCNVAPNLSRAASMFLRAWTACANGSPWPTMPPSSAVAVVPETNTNGPARTG